MLCDFRAAGMIFFAVFFAFIGQIPVFVHKIALVALEVQFSAFYYFGYHSCFKCICCSPIFVFIDSCYLFQAHCAASKSPKNSQSGQSSQQQISPNLSIQSYTVAPKARATKRPMQISSLCPFFPGFVSFFDLIIY